MNESTRKPYDVLLDKLRGGNHHVHSDEARHLFYDFKESLCTILADNSPIGEAQEPTETYEYECDCGHKWTDPLDTWIHCPKCEANTAPMNSQIVATTENQSDTSASDDTLAAAIILGFTDRKYGDKLRDILRGLLDRTDMIGAQVEKDTFSHVSIQEVAKLEKRIEEVDSRIAANEAVQIGRNGYVDGKLKSLAIRIEECDKFGTELLETFHTHAKLMDKYAKIQSRIVAAIPELPEAEVVEGSHAEETALRFATAFLDWHGSSTSDPKQTKWKFERLAVALECAQQIAGRLPEEPESPHTFSVLCHIEETDAEGECVRCHDDPTELSSHFITLEAAQTWVKNLEEFDANL